MPLPEGPLPQCTPTPPRAVPQPGAHRGAERCPRGQAHAACCPATRSPSQRLLPQAWAATPDPPRPPLPALVESRRDAPGAAGNTYHLVVMVAVRDVGLLEKGAEGRL